MKYLGKITDNKDLVTKEYVDNADAGKANASHTHDDRYYTESEVDTKLNGKANSSHTHDDRYYTESEVDTKLAGKAASSHTHLPTQITQGQAAVSGGLDPLTQAMVGSAASNKTFGLPAAAIKIEYSTNGGSTWTDYGATDAQKKALFAETRGFWPVLGKSASASTNTVNNQLRITIEPTDRYVSVNGLYIWMSTSGNTVTVDLEHSTIGAKDTFSTIFTGQGIAGWSGNNIRYFSGGSFGGGSTQTSNWYKYRLTFKQTAVNTSYNSASIGDIRFFGVNVWSNPNNMVGKNHMYTWDENLNVTFPAQVNGTINVGTTTGTLAVAHGGTGQTTAQAAANALLGGLDNTAAQSTDFTDNTSLITTNVNGTTGTYYHRKASLLWNYIKSKISSVLGLTATNYGGKAATAGTADSATNASKVNNHTVNADVPSGAKFTDTTALGSMTGTLGIDHGGTGATDALTAFFNLEYRETAADLNNALGRGVYSWNTSSANIPVANTYGALYCIVGNSGKEHNNSSNGIWQIAVDTSNNYNVYLRQKINNGAWTAWKSIDTTYSSKSAASGGTAVSLVTTGEKYTWNNKSNLTIGTTATTAAAGNHSHSTATTSAAGFLPKLGGGTTNFLRADGTWAPPAGGASTALTVTLAAASWSNDSQTVNATGVTANNNIVVTPDASSVSDYVDAGILCTGQAAGKLTFECSDTPTTAITVNVLILP